MLGSSANCALKAQWRSQSAQLLVVSLFWFSFKILAVLCLETPLLLLAVVGLPNSTVTCFVLFCLSSQGHFAWFSLSSLFFLKSLESHQSSYSAHRFCGSEYVACANHHSHQLQTV